MLRLGVNIDHVATLREARKTTYPDPLDAARLCRDAGAHGLTVHLREDRRHIQDDDVRRLKQADILPLNLEMGNHPEIVDFAVQLRPDEVCLIPEKRAELTTEGGLDVAGQKAGLQATLTRMQHAGIVVSLFIDPDPAQIEAASELGAPYIELHTGSYCDSFGVAADHELDRLKRGAELAHRLGLKVNAGHGIHLGNLPGILQIPHLDTLNIGHSLVARAVLVGMRAAVEEMLQAMAGP